MTNVTFTDEDIQRAVEQAHRMGWRMAWVSKLGNVWGSRDTKTNWRLVGNVLDVANYVETSEETAP